MNAILFDEEAVFHEARRIGDPEARDAYLRQVCDDAARRGRLDALLHVCEHEAGFLETPAEVPPTVAVPGSLSPPRAPGRSSALASCWSRSARGGWAPSSWPSSRTRCAARSR